VILILNCTIDDLDLLFAILVVIRTSECFKHIFQALVFFTIIIYFITVYFISISRRNIGILFYILCGISKELTLFDKARCFEFRKSLNIESVLFCIETQLKLFGHVSRITQEMVPKQEPLGASTKPNVGGLADCDVWRLNPDLLPRSPGGHERALKKEHSITTARCTSWQCQRISA